MKTQWMVLIFLDKSDFLLRTFKTYGIMAWKGVPRHENECQEDKLCWLCELL